MGCGIEVEEDKFLEWGVGWRSGHGDGVWAELGKLHVKDYLFPIICPTLFHSQEMHAKIVDACK